MSRSRSAFTLLELIVVLAIIAVVTALALPSIDMMYADQKPVNAGDSVRAKWALARSQAIKDGVPYNYGVVWGQSSWRVAPDGASYWGSGTANVPSGMYTESGNLPHDVRFVPDGAAGTDDKQTPSPDANTLDGSEFTVLATFHPDGSIEVYPPDNNPNEDQLHVGLEVKHSSRLVLTLRSITGAVTSDWDSGAP